MLPLVLAGLGALVLSNPIRNGRRGAAAKRRILRRVTKAARTNKRSGGAREACHASVRAQFFAAECGVRSKRISRAVVRGIKQGRRNPRKLDKVHVRYFASTGPDASHFGHTISIHEKLSAAVSAVGKRRDGWVYAIIRSEDTAYGHGPRRVVKASDAWTREYAERYIEATKRSNPTRRTRVSPGGAAARLAKWRWHHNPAIKSSYRLADGSLLSAPQLKQMFMGKIPTPAQRRLLGITLVRDSR
jgi:hypothetical protein